MDRDLMNEYISKGYSIVDAVNKAWKDYEKKLKPIEGSGITVTYHGTFTPTLDIDDTKERYTYTTTFER